MGDPEFPLQYLRHSRAAPKIPAKLIGCRAADARRQHPLAHQTFRNTERNSDITLLPTNALQMQCPQTPPLFRRRIRTGSLIQPTSSRVHLLLDAQEKTLVRFAVFSKKQGNCI